MPGYTHTRAAEPITFGHLRGGPRLGPRARPRAPARRAARASTSCPSARAPSRAPRFPSTARPWPATSASRPSPQNALDAVIDRDFAAEFVFACAQLQTHLARLRRGPHPLLGARVRLRHPARGLHHRLEPHAAEEEPRRARARARQGGARGRRPAAAARPDEGPAGGLPEGPAGGQGGGLRRRRHRRWPRSRS